MGFCSTMVLGTIDINVCRYHPYYLSENRNPSKSLSYILVIVFLPLVGLLVYYFVCKKPG